MMMNEEAMTNEEAINLLSQVRDAILASNSWLPSTDNPIKECFGMAIEALKAQEKAQEVSNDSPELDKENGELISRQAAIDALDEQITICDKALGSFDISMKDEYAIKVERASLEAYRETLNALPSVQPETHDERTETHGVCLDTIDRQAALDWLKNEWNGMVTSLFDGIKALPSAQPEIIHCRDCKHWREGDAYSYCQKLFNCGVLDVYDYMRADDDFCSEAERRTNG